MRKSVYKDIFDFLKQVILVYKASCYTGLAH